MLKKSMYGAPTECQMERFTKVNGLRIWNKRKVLVFKSGRMGLSMKDYGLIIKQMAKEG